MINWLEESSFYRAVYEEGVRKGYRKGFQEGYQRGLWKGQVAIKRLILLLQSCGVPIEYLLEIIEMTREELEAADELED